MILICILYFPIIHTIIYQYWHCSSLLTCSVLSGTNIRESVVSQQFLLKVKLESCFCCVGPWSTVKKITHSNSVTQASHWCELKAISLIHDSGLESIWSGLSAGSNSLCLKLICIFQQGCPIHLSYLNL